MTLKLDLLMLAGREVNCYNDKKAVKGQLPDAQMKRVKVDRNGKLKVTIQPSGGLIIE